MDSNTQIRPTTENDLAKTAANGAISALAGAAALGVVGFLVGGPPGAWFAAKLGAMLGSGGAAGNPRTYC